MNNSKNKLSLALLAVLCIVMVAMGIWGFTLGNTVTLSAAELAAPAATEAPAEEAEAATEEAAAEETAEEAAAGEELAEVAEDSAASLQESAIAEHLAERSGLQSFAYLKRFPLLITGILLGLAFVVALLISGNKMRMPEGILHSKLTYAVVAELAILMVCLWIRPDFFSIRYEPSSGMLIGSLITILNRSAEITIIAMGMTLVIALGGTDISVGALVAVSGALALKFLRWDIDVYTTPGDYTVQPFVWVIVVPLAVCLLMGLFNGALVAKLNIQPIIATLILMVAGRGIAQIVTDGKQYTTGYTPFQFIGGGSFLGLPMPVIISIVVVAACGAVHPQDGVWHVRRIRGRQPQRQPRFRPALGPHHTHRLHAHRFPGGHLGPDLLQPHLFLRLQQRRPQL